MLEEVRYLFHRQRGKVGDRLIAEAHMQRSRVQALACARGTRLVDLQPAQPCIEHGIVGAGFLALLAPIDIGEREAGTETRAAPAVLGVEREQAGIELGETLAASGARALG